MDRRHLIQSFAYSLSMHRLHASDNGYSTGAKQISPLGVHLQERRSGVRRMLDRGMLPHAPTQATVLAKLERKEAKSINVGMTARTMETVRTDFVAWSDQRLNNLTLDAPPRFCKSFANIKNKPKSRPVECYGSFAASFSTASIDAWSDCWFAESPQ